MKTFAKGLVALLVVLLVLGLGGCQKNTINTIKKDLNTAEGEYSGKTVIVHSNDVHGYLQGYAYVADARDYFVSQGANVILVDCGDFSQGSAYVSLSKGASATDVMDQTGYDIVALGNHEFDYGVGQLKGNVADKSFKVICSSVTENGKALFDDKMIVQVGDLKVGFFALLSPETKTKVNPNLIKGLSFPEKEELYALAQKEIDELKDKCDLVVCIAHLGDNFDESAGNTSYDVYNNTTGIDFILDGHSHSVLERGTNNEPIQSTGTKAEYVGAVIVDNKTKKIEDNYLISTEGVEAVSEVLAVAQKYVDDIDAEYGKPFASTEVFLNGDKPIVRSQETNLGDLVCDSMLWSILKEGSIDVDNDHLIVITNGGGIRANLEIGDISKADVNTVLPFGNTLAVDYVKGSELLEVLEASTFCTPETVGGFPQVAGIEFTIDTTVPYDQGDQYPDSTYFKPNSINRVTINSINGKEFDPEATYAVITNNFCAAGGDTYYAFYSAYQRGDGFDTGIVLDEALMDFISEELGGVIGSEYAEPQGRITIVTAE